MSLCLIGSHIERPCPVTFTIVSHTVVWLCITLNGCPSQCYCYLLKTTWVFNEIGMYNLFASNAMDINHVCGTIWLITMYKRLFDCYPKLQNKYTLLLTTFGRNTTLPTHYRCLITNDKTVLHVSYMINIWECEMKRKRKYLTWSTLEICVFFYFLLVCNYRTKPSIHCKLWYKPALTYD